MLEVALIALAMLLLTFAAFTLSKALLALALIVVLLPSVYAFAKGAPFVPTPRKYLTDMLRLAAIRPGQKVYDLGCGDGRLVFAAAKQGAVSMGYELSIPVYLWAKIRSFFHPGSRILWRDFWKQDYRDADVVFCFLLKSTMPHFAASVWPQLKPGCRIVSYGFRLPGVPAEEEAGDVFLYVRS
jgi:hypothetical protein